MTPISLSELEPHLKDKPVEAKPIEDMLVENTAVHNDLEKSGRAMLYASRWPGVPEHGGNGESARNQAAYRHTRELTNDFTLAPGDAWPLIQAWNKTNKPPLDPGELRAAFDSALKGKPQEDHPRGGKLTAKAASRHEIPLEIEVVDAGEWLKTEPPESDQIIAGMFDRGDKVAIIGSSKLRKSFFLLQKMMCISTGLDFLGWVVPKPRRVLMVQFEIQTHHFHRRVRRMATGLDLRPIDLEGRLRIVNARGLGLSGEAGVKAIAEAAKDFGPEVICLDPLYKIATGVENAAEDLKLVLNLFDVLAEQTGAAVIYVHHDPKGVAGDRDVRDRGAGSNVLGRDYDACFALTSHASEDDAVVIEALLRNYRPQDPCTIGWTEDMAGGYCFRLRPDLAATKKTSATPKTSTAVVNDTCHDIALTMLKGGPMPVRDFKAALRDKSGYGRNRVDDYVRWALTQADDTLDVHETRGRGKHIKYVGTEDQIRQLESEETSNEKV